MVWYCNFYILAKQNLSLVVPIMNPVVLEDYQIKIMPNTPQPRHEWNEETPKKS
jgi:hypothetical protein